MLKLPFANTVLISCKYITFLDCELFAYIIRMRFNNNFVIIFQYESHIKWTLKSLNFFTLRMYSNKYYAKISYCILRLFDKINTIAQMQLIIFNKNIIEKKKEKPVQNWAFTRCFLFYFSFSFSHFQFIHCTTSL